MAKRLLIVAHAPSPNTIAMREAALRGAGNQTIEGVQVDCRGPFETEPTHVIGAQAILIGTTENLGYMAGAIKDFFDRCYYPCIERTQGLPYAVYIRAGHDGTGTRRAMESIATGLRWRAVRDPLLCRGAWQPAFLDECEELGMLMAAGLEAGVF